MSQPLLVLAAGGTGGHMFPAQALAEAMIDKGWRVKLTTDPRGARYTGRFPQDVQIEVLSSGTFARSGLASKVMAPFQIAGGTLKAVGQFVSDRPAVVAGFGGYPSIPAIAAATLLRIPRMIQEQNGVLGRVNQIFAKRVNAVACGTWPTELPDGVEGLHTGNPVRQAILNKAEAPYIEPGDYPMSILIMGGSQGARILSDVVPPAIAGLSMETRARLRVFQQARPEDIDRVTDFYAAEHITATVQPFFDNVPELMSDCQMVIARSGASTVADISVIGRPSILVPYAAAVRDEQTANARGLVDAGAAILMPESTLEVDALTAQIALILETPEGARQMAKAALSTAVPDATTRLTNLVEHLSKQ